jgi:hypothetical protein
MMAEQMTSKVEIFAESVDNELNKLAYAFMAPLVGAAARIVGGTLLRTGLKKGIGAVGQKAATMATAKGAKIVAKSAVKDVAGQSVVNTAVRAADAISAPKQEQTKMAGVLGTGSAARAAHRAVKFGWKSRGLAGAAVTGAVKALPMAVGSAAVRVGQNVNETVNQQSNTQPVSR